MFGYSAYRIFEESLRIDSSVHIFGLRLNMYIASVLTVFGAVWFYRTQRRPERTLVASPPAASGQSPAPADDAADPPPPPADTEQAHDAGQPAPGS